MKIKTNCRFYKGDIPCKFHKEKGVHCDNCEYYKKVSKRILIIKFGAAGDVIRTTPILRRLKGIYPDSEITWLSIFPELLPSIVDYPLKFELSNVVSLLGDKFDILYNLDKDKETCSLANLISADIKKGFILKDGKCSPIDKDAEHKFSTGLWDDIEKANKKHYVEEIFEVCGFSFSGEKYILELKGRAPELPKLKGRIVGLNTGCGGRWETRNWSEENWVTLAKKLKSTGFVPLLLGGLQEDEKNKRIKTKSGAEYWGAFSLKDFLWVVNMCEVVVTQVTMALHIAIGFEKKIILLNNIFNRNEFELYGLGEIIEPELDCLGCYKSKCEKDCMSIILPEKVLEKCMKLYETR
ncbi:MAG: glycosyltransferase family 9 protein [bacterium]|nr:glycosyltransferase family 9 protein [bacterium]